LKRRRRINGVSAESGQAIIQLKDEIRNEDFRTGGPVLCQLPAFSVKIRSVAAEKAWPTLQEIVRGILLQLKVEVRTLELTGRQHPMDKDPPLQNTIFVLARKVEPTNKWLNACLEIRRFCASRGFGELNVEIADDRGLVPKVSCWVRHDHPIAAVWQDIRLKIVEILGHRDWLALELLGRGLKDGAPQVTVVVTIDIDTEGDGWPVIADRISAVLDEAGQISVGVEIIRGNVWRSTPPVVSTTSGPTLTENAHRQILQDDSYRDEVKLGGSIQVQNPDVGPGTFGGVVRLHRKNGTFKDFGLTCFHCVISSKSPSPLHLSWMQQEFKPGQMKTPFLVDSPSPRDHRETMLCLEYYIRTKETPAFREMALKLADPDDFVPPYQQRTHFSTAQAIDGPVQQKKLGDDFFAAKKEPLGTVFAGSGFRLSEKTTHSLDWALIDLKKGRQGRNTVSSSLSMIYCEEHQLTHSQATSNWRCSIGWKVALPPSRP
jgi:hypothetical protein